MTRTCALLVTLNSALASLVGCVAPEAADDAESGASLTCPTPTPSTVTVVGSGSGPGRSVLGWCRASDQACQDQLTAQYANYSCWNEENAGLNALYQAANDEYQLSYNQLVTCEGTCGSPFSWPHIVSTESEQPNLSWVGGVQHSVDGDLWTAYCAYPSSFYIKGTFTFLCYR
jgi:hypothetical protein